MNKEEIKKELQEMLDECMSSYNQEGSLVITDIEIDEDGEYGQEGSGNIEFTWCTPEDKPYFVGY